MGKMEKYTKSNGKNIPNLTYNTPNLSNGKNIPKGDGFTLIHLKLRISQLGVFCIDN
jgi:hypothetical protein